MNDRRDDELRARLEKRFAEAILGFPRRLDAMETRDEASCRKLAADLARLAEEEIAGAGGGSR